MDTLAPEVAESKESFLPVHVGALAAFREHGNPPEDYLQWSTKCVKLSSYRDEAECLMKVPGGDAVYSQGPSTRVSNYVKVASTLLKLRCKNYTPGCKEDLHPRVG